MPALAHQPVQSDVWWRTLERNCHHIQARSDGDGYKELPQGGAGKVLHCLVRRRIHWRLKIQVPNGRRKHAVRVLLIQLPRAA